MKKLEEKSKVYIFKGDGLGIAGLAHRMTLEEAQQAGVLDLLQAAIEAGVYAEGADDGK